MTKAFFIYEFDGEIQDLFNDEHTTKRSLDRTKLTNVDTIEYLKRVIVSSNLNLFKKINPISLDFDSLHDVFPEHINTEEVNQTIKFKLKSKSIELLELKMDNITFADHNNNIINTKIPDNYKLYKS